LLQASVTWVTGTYVFLQASVTQISGTCVFLQGSEIRVAGSKKAVLLTSAAFLGIMAKSQFSLKGLEFF
jgi:hypothetical protein